jgi:hypothetical protein
MTFKSARWYPAAVVLSGLNLVGVGAAAASAEPWHAAIHATLALAFGLWAQRLRRSPAPLEGQDRLDLLDGEVGDLRRELSEIQERMDFAERVLAQEAEQRRVGPER